MGGGSARTVPTYALVDMTADGSSCSREQRFYEASETVENGIKRKTRSTWMTATLETEPRGLYGLGVSTTCAGHQSDLSRVKQTKTRPLRRRDCALQKEFLISTNVVKSMRPSCWETWMASHRPATSSSRAVVAERRNAHLPAEKELRAIRINESLGHSS